MIYYKKECNLEAMNAQELLKIIRDTNLSLQDRDNVMYYLLNERLAQSLRRRFEPYKCKLEDSYEDVLMDFFLYLRGSDGTLYKKLINLKHDSSFEGWLIISFRNFTAKRAFTESRFLKYSEQMDPIDFQDVEQIPMDRMICMLSTLVAYCCQEFNNISRLIFLRTLLTMLDKSRALPDKEVAASLGITEIYYRVINYRLRCKIQKIKEMILCGAQLELAPESKRFANNLNEDFSDWYQKLSACYEATLASLPQYETINELRKLHAPQNDGLLHDHTASPYGNARTLWNGIGRRDMYDFRNLREWLA